MSFLNPFMLLGALGIALPILAHLINRFEVRRTDWAAMRFLNRNVRVRSRQIRLRDLLLLILRCLAVLLLVLALSRPTWTGDFPLPGERRAGVVIAIDTSFSMGHGPEADSRIDRALERVNVITRRLHPGDPVSLVLLGEEHEVVVRNMAYDETRFRDAVATVKPGAGTLDLDSLPKQLAEVAADLQAPRKEVYLITDTQARDWKQPSTQLRESLAALASETSLFLVPISGENTNLAVTSLDLVSGALRKGTTARYQAKVGNFGDAPATNVAVHCRVDGVQIDTKTIPLIEPGASESVSLFVPFHNSGSTRISAAIEDDALTADNVRHAVTVVRDRISVLCVDGSSSGDAGRLVVDALLARGDGAEDEDYVVRSIPWLTLPAENLDEIDVLVMADVPEVTPEQATQLDAFVRRGNGLVWFAGDAVKSDVWNERAATLLPAVLGNSVDVGNAAGTGRPLDPGMPDHPVCLPLLSLPEDLFSETRFLRQLDVEPSPSSFAVLRLAGSGSPILLEHSLGRGHVFLFTSTADRLWNNMGLTPVFPMLMQQIITYLAGREFEQPRLVGDSLSLAYIQQPDASDAVFDTPSGETITVPVIQHRGQYVALLEKAREAGFYTARVSVQAPGMPVAVNIDPRESDVTTLPESEIRANLEGLGITVATTGEDLGSAIDAARTGRSAWRFFLIAALAILVIESLFADRLLRRNLSREGPTAEPVTTPPATANA